MCLRDQWRCTSIQYMVDQWDGADAFREAPSGVWKIVPVWRSGRHIFSDRVVSFVDLLPNIYVNGSEERDIRCKNDKAAMAVVIFTPRPNSQDFQERRIQLSESVKIGRSVAKVKSAASNLIFDCKVLSRNHAIVWYEGGKVRQCTFL